jgi:hypothetical protein
MEVLVLAVFVRPPRRPFRILRAPERVGIVWRWKARTAASLPPGYEQNFWNAA